MNEIKGEIDQKRDRGDDQDYPLNGRIIESED